MGLRQKFDEGYTEQPDGTARHRLFTDALDLPSEVEPNSFVTPEVLREIGAALRLPPGGRLVDVACGRGGTGLWLARELGATLLGVDFSAVAVRQAAGRRGLFGLIDRASYWVADQAATGLADATADAVLSIDAIQFSPDPVAVAREARRVLRPGGRYVLTNWEPRDPADTAVPARMRALDFARLLTEAGLAVHEVTERPDLMRRQQQIFESALRTDPTGDPALTRLRDEAVLVAPWPHLMRRVLVVAERPT